MRLCGKQALFGFGALLIAILGVTLLVAVPALAGEPDQEKHGTDGLVTSNLGV